MNKDRMTLQALKLPKNLRLRRKAGNKTIQRLFVAKEEAAMNDPIQMLFVTPLAARSHASNVIV
ncbi:hypothetical protein NXC14_PB00496 (plasmid) [Rhizobium sp. NXC14]|nr:hypothetical protein NXC14_PB00496 [Rhizobium sp. NXC14]